MNMHLSLSLLCAIAISGCATATEPPTAAGSSVETQPTANDPAQLRAQTQAIVDAFAAGVTQARGATLGNAPAVEVKSSPQLIFFDFEPNTIIVPDWNTQPAEVREVFKTFAGGNEADAERLFRAFFNRFLVAHETGHWLQYKTWRGGPPDLYRHEQDANRLAVAFWRTQPGGEAFLSELQQLAERAAAALPDPTPRGEDPAAYFGKHYQELGADPMKYGYYQFRFIADALRMRQQLDFAAMAARPHSGSGAADSADTVAH